MIWASAVSDNPSLEDALAACIQETLPSMERRRPDLAVVFVSPHHAANYHLVPEIIQSSFRPKVIFGCSAGGVIGGGHEIEMRPGVSLTIARMPDVMITPFRVDDSQLPNPDAAPREWESLVQTSRAWGPEFMVLADPFTIRTEEFLTGLDYAFPRSTKIGGIASGADRPGDNALFLGDAVYSQGAIGLAFAGNIQVDSIVAQGCRPIGSPVRVTQCRGNLLVETDGRPVMETLRDIYAGLNDGDRDLFRHSLFLGVVMDELQSDYKLGDFVIRNVLGNDPDKRGLVIGEMLRENQTVQFHLLDERTASDDLEEMLAQYAAEHNPAEAQGAILFSCLGRGLHLFGRPDHDTQMFRDKFGALPLGGFFGNGEIGPVSGSTFIHGHTSSFGIFRPKWVE